MKNTIFATKVVMMVIIGITSSVLSFTLITLSKKNKEIIELQEKLKRCNNKESVSQNQNPYRIWTVYELSVLEGIQGGTVKLSPNLYLHRFGANGKVTYEAVDN